MRSVVLRNLSLQNKKIEARFLLLLLCLFSLQSISQIANYVNNGSFEDLYNCSQPNYLVKAKYWRCLDSTTFTPIICSTCTGFASVPLNTLTYQWPRTGNNYALGGLFCPPPSCSPIVNRMYFRNRLKANLKAGKTYCVKFYVNICWNSTYGMDGFGAYFGDNSLDTITKTAVPLTYLQPQVQNPSNNLITDTLNWTLITGTFVATGNEKHLVIGNFKSDVATNTVLINPNNPPLVATDVCIDDVSCIDIDLPAFAGRDTMCIPGTSVYIGRQRDVGIDEACQWYQLPNLTTAIDTAAGIWVNPLTTSTYVVKQEICSNVKWDTVVVYQTALGLNELKIMGDQLKVFPVPAKDVINLQFLMDVPDTEFNTVFIYNHLGQMIRKQNIKIGTAVTKVDISDLTSGMYFLQLTGDSLWSINKHIVISKP